jgi:hypothetical protein
MSELTDTPQPPPPRPAVLVSRPATTGETVTIACKMPHGIILRIFDWEEYDEPMRDGSWKKVKRGREIPELQFVARGAWLGSAGQAYNPNNPAVAELLPGGYALTPGCPKEVWDRWHEQNVQSNLVRNKIIFAHHSHSTVQQEASGLRATKTGLEPLDPQKPADRMPGGVDRRLRVGVLDRETG